jgi:hypothetical protein
VALNFHLETSLRLLKVLKSTHFNKLTKIPNSLRPTDNKKREQHTPPDRKKGRRGRGGS